MTNPARPRLLVCQGREAPESKESWLTASERAVAAAMAYPRRRSGYLGRRWAGKTLVRDVLGVEDLRRIGIGNDDSGRPFLSLDGERLDVSVSLSDSGPVSVAALGPAPSVVGIDVEILQRRSPGLVRDFFTADEAAAVNRATDEPLAANLIWSAKESALKVRGSGLREDTRNVEVQRPDLTGATVGGWRSLLVECADGQRLSGWWLRGGEWVLTFLSEPASSQPIVSGTPMIENPPST